MAVFDTIGIIMVSASLLAFTALAGFIVLKIGLTSFKIVMEPLKAARGIENIEGVVKDSRYRITEEEKDEFEIITSFIKAEIDRNSYAKYLYKRFKIEMIIAQVNSFTSSIESKIEKNHYIKYLYEFKIEIVFEHLNSLRNSIRARIKKNNYTKYAYIQLFKK